ncbi:hypothetical protein SeMB42_g05849 [Synchytrium endobioticum]|uniref:Calcium-transporting ATPase n=1 Tax=Synchytrium endobioticum TaxID=286115 RepID=A0A507CP00_9FUNG|nr:hypothetical protein SeMB42_g05849 [Synchytrium endobioticum]TPX44168.1 hypothetical protein SeLEV6574_g04669 [Synchytrium endobioticum]
MPTQSAPIDLDRTDSELSRLSPLHKSWTLSAKQVCQLLRVNPRTGLPKSDVDKRAEEYGKNELPHDPPTPLWKLVLEQFQDQLVLILLGAAVISFVLAALETDEREKSTAFVEPIVILLILIANAVVGVVQESNAEKAIEALMEYSPDDTTVIRDGAPHKVHAKDLVPGDIVSLSVGDKIPADCRLLQVTSAAFRVDQAILTGESVSVEKVADHIVSDVRAVKQDQINMLFSGTTITIGKAVAVVVQTGTSTAIGAIHKSISSQIDEKTPLKQALDDFGDQLARIISVICILVWIINVRHFNDPTFHGNWLKGAVYYFKIAVALAVAAIPEGLAVVITTCLALGTKKMAAQGAIVRKLRSVETLGCTTIICSDKTGTLTTNQMSARKVLVVGSGVGGLMEFDVEGTTYGPEGRVHHSSGKHCDRNVLASHPVLNELAHVACLCNDAKIVYDQEADQFLKVGEPTEAALRALVEKLGTDSPDFNQQIPIIQTSVDLAQLSAREKLWRSGQACEYVESKYKKHTTLEFSRERKSMSVFVEKLEGAEKGLKYLMVKGAPEQILERSVYVRVNSSPDKAVPLTDALKEKILGKMVEWGERDSLRVLAFAILENPSIPEKFDPNLYAKIEANLTFIGLVGMLDPPRPQVKSSISKCRAAGIRVIVITGDNKKTAESICRQIGIFTARQNLEGKSYTSREWDDMSLEQKRDAVRRASLFSRAEPSHKQELVDLLKNEGWVVAMTGDGVNDAPALKKADIGIAMGSGTDVAKLASDMVLADDNFATIVAAVEEGRSIYANTKQFIRYLISSNIGEVVSIFLTVILGMPEALIPVQLLWVNLVTDGLPATALGFNPADHDIMRQPPRDSKEPIVTAWLFIRYMVVGTYVGMATVFGYAWWFMYYSGGPQISFHQLTHFHKCTTLFPEIGCEMFTNMMSKKATTMSLSILVVVEMFNAMNSLSENESLITFPLWNNVYLILAISLSMVLHFMILYFPFFTNLFAIVPLNYEEWKWVLLISFPVVIVDEILKYISRKFVSKQTAQSVDKKRD